MCGLQGVVFGSCDIRNYSGSFPISSRDSVDISRSWNRQREVLANSEIKSWMSCSGRAIANDDGSPEALEIICKAFGRGDRVCTDEDINVAPVFGSSSMGSDPVFPFSPRPVSRENHQNAPVCQKDNP